MFLDDLELRQHPEEKSPHPHFKRHDLKRQSSDRLPHRPAPPVPVPGHKPVRRSLRRVAARSSSSPGKNTSSKDHYRLQLRKRLGSGGKRAMIEMGK